jgi:hypothetical protein
VRLNAQAANRFIQHALAPQSSEQLEQSQKQTNKLNEKKNKTTTTNTSTPKKRKQ